LIERLLFELNRIWAHKPEKNSLKTQSK